MHEALRPFQAPGPVNVIVQKLSLTGGKRNGLAPAPAPAVAAPTAATGTATATAIPAPAPAPSCSSSCSCYCYGCYDKEDHHCVDRHHRDQEHHDHDDYQCFSSVVATAGLIAGAVCPGKMAWP